ncbi:hypothetical protein [uncultured Shewanella sp.]|uniref:hypothetical protein n=1 Tax=uncultured Shewanella sp. TaxID=173975 RepID=UPI00262373D0|nr:hypothetical protein [uncultured Shewanella sp.]
MARFQGTVLEFHHFIGPRIKRVIHRRIKHHVNKSNGVCEYCYQNVVASVLNPFLLSEGMVSCDINTVEQAILSAFGAISQTPTLICHSCYTSYDINSEARHAEIEGSAKQRRSFVDQVTPEFTKIDRIRLWANKPHQINYKMIKAFLELDGYEPLGVPLYKAATSRVLR